MQFRQIPPPQYLRDYIRFFWVLESNDKDVAAATFRTIADGCPGLIFQHRDHGILFQNDKQLPGTILYGQATRHAALRIDGRFDTIGIFFYPHALKSIFGLNADELTDTCLDLDGIPASRGFQLSAQLTDISAPEARIDILCSFLLAQLTKYHQQSDKAMHHALDRIRQTNGNISVKALREELQLSERSFERKFKQHVGITPKLFARIAQFQASMQLIRQSDYNKLSDIAFENEYADQSHFIRAFKEFAGASPFQFMKKSEELIENLSILTK
ncbi:helix-turn-helix transcriptional regulator [Chitinophaga pinensis]|uniref:Transcriptional regulator, AraC family n=1 Tax=Chitinophaga pinensis (strain ATCC 43595 / DSM 2588 / LMG 13176 / NBRC 15968 / NCIMB 11800 / UQM 2034) TaxID=485918 RepID=A0A979G4J0_CHIPD|nr:helix-turn-helix transcriptional regulator [Chitinophaga pinensis]ACU60749.1 transcriptional regulator, AraC family [Chitinophaga pinensis DSM 2588]